MNPQHAAIRRAADDLRATRYYDLDQAPTFLGDLGDLATEIAVLLTAAGVTWEAMSDAAAGTGIAAQLTSDADRIERALTIPLHDLRSQTDV